MQYPQDNLGNTGERVDYTYQDQLTLDSVLGNFPEAYALNTLYDTSGRVVVRKMGDLGHLTTQFQYHPWTTQGGRLQRTTSGMDNGQLDALMDLRYHLRRGGERAHHPGLQDRQPADADLHL